MLRKSKITRGSMLLLALLASVPSAIQAQEKGDQHDVTIFNADVYTYAVFVLDAQGEKHNLGYVDHDQTARFDVAANIEAMGPYQIAVQQVMPVPGLGVTAMAYPLKVTHIPADKSNRPVSIVVDAEPQLSTVEVY